MIIVIDNNDSFTYNLIDYIATETEMPIKVISVDEVTLEGLEQLEPTAIVISPGPGRPSDYPILSDILTKYYQQIPILGICLGFQLIYEYFGGQIIHNDRPVHGHTTKINHTNQGIFRGLPQHFNVMRYHSLMANPQTLPDSLIMTAENAEHIMMGLQHRLLPIFAVQYHPESILSEYGHDQIRLFFNEVGVTNECRI